ncbi:MAG TPA: ATP-binding SpoIIE family protein phosphatase, partial [Planctomycetaceae bacterium]|nr:ATP-binding SpoIIE family protein phosphatase [Planctomycetaceae bacterium]
MNSGVRDPSLVPMSDSSRVGEARRTATQLAARLGFDETDQGKAALIASELASNLIKHARDGELIVQSICRGDQVGLELISLDRGPGISNPAQALRDGHSTAGTAGAGLGAVRRMSDEFDLYSTREKGTALVSRFWQKPRVSQTCEYAVVSRPYPGEVVCGDGWCVLPRGPQTLVMVVDGLGHGLLAAEAAQTAVRVLQRDPDRSPLEIMHALHAALRSTRGAAVAVARISNDQQTLAFAGVGNIAGHIFAGTERRNLVSYNGTVGHEMRKVQEFQHPWSSRSKLLLHSDGISTSWSLDQYPGLLHRHPALLAGVLSRDHQRGRDDATVLVVQ